MVDLMGFREAPKLPMGEVVYRPRLKVRLGAGAQASFRIGLKRLAHRPTYEQPSFD